MRSELRPLAVAVIGLATACGSGAKTMKLPRCTTSAEVESIDLLEER